MDRVSDDDSECGGGERGGARGVGSLVPEMEPLSGRNREKASNGRTEVTKLGKVPVFAKSSLHFHNPIFDSRS